VQLSQYPTETTLVSNAPGKLRFFFPMYTNSVSSIIYLRKVLVHSWQVMFLIFIVTEILGFCNDCFSFSVLLEKVKSEPDTFVNTDVQETKACEDAQLENHCEGLLQFPISHTFSFIVLNISPAYKYILEFKCFSFFFRFFSFL